MQRIVPCLWFETDVEEASRFYASCFENTKKWIVTYFNEEGFELHWRESWTVMTINIEIEWLNICLLNWGPYFKLNPSISFFIACYTKKEVDTLWSKLSKWWTALMELWSYPFSEHYGWIQDKFWVSWQIMYMWDLKATQKIIPTLMFTKNHCGEAEKAMQLYTSLFKNGKIWWIMRYEKWEEPDKEWSVKHASFFLDGQEFAAMDSAYTHDFTFSEAVSFIVNCKDQKEVDFFWDELWKWWDEASKQCGWLKDKFWVSWQITPMQWEEMFVNASQEDAKALMKSMLQMKKIDIAELEKIVKK